MSTGLGQIYCDFFSAQPSQFWFSSSGVNVWRSTGLYAKAGTIVTVTFPDNAVGKLGVSNNAIL